MPRYFIEVAYVGTLHQGLQAQPNIKTIQGEINYVLETILKSKDIITIASSRTDASVHALQNFFHFDINESLSDSIIYNLNAVLSKNIVIKKLILVKDNAHARFDAISRSYAYHIISKKNPFLNSFAYYYPFKLDITQMSEAINKLLLHTDFTSFSKRKTDAKTFNCNIISAHLEILPDEIIFRITANRFLRGMVRAIVGTLLLVARNKITVEDFENIILLKDCTKADFSAPAHGLFLKKIIYKDDIYL